MRRLLYAIRIALKIRRRAMVAGEAIAWYHGAIGVREVKRRVHGADTDEERLLAEWTAHFAEKRLRDLNSVDTTTRYDVVAGWKRRHGSMII